MWSFLLRNSLALQELKLGLGLGLGSQTHRFSEIKKEEH